MFQFFQNAQEHVALPLKMRGMWTSSVFSLKPMGSFFSSYIVIKEMDNRALYETKVNETKLWNEFVNNFQK